MYQASMSRSIFSFVQKMLRSAQGKQSLVRTIGWDGIAVALNVLLLSLNLRQHFHYREPLDSYQPIHAESVVLLSQEKIKMELLVPHASASEASAVSSTMPPLDQTKPSYLPTINAFETKTNSSAAPTTSAIPSNTPKTQVRPLQSHVTTAGSTHSPAASILPGVKIPQTVVYGAEPAPMSEKKLTTSSCTVFGPLTFNRLQQLKREWKNEGYATGLDSTTTQPVQLYSVIYPPIASATAETKRSELSKAGFKRHEIWVEGHSAAVIVLGSFEDADAANQLVQRLHQKGFKEARLMARTSPTVYWLRDSDSLKQWINSPSIAKAEGVHWKTVPCH